MVLVLCQCYLNGDAIFPIIWLLAEPVAWQEDLAKKMKEAALSGLSERHPINGNDHELLTKRVHQVLQFHGEGILLKQLPTVYQVKECAPCW